MTIAKTILSQIRAIDPRALWAWGAKDFVDVSNGLQFKTSGMCKWKGHVLVEYNEGSDLYDIRFFRIRSGRPVMDRKSSGVYVDELVHVIDLQVG